ncbi:uncharacterized protein VTP21DRAFT_10881 [Calcarisporiella thermophila]|uniref:uncharacterized protein n=1 Tax=Calcarisporiella thermophila TaxID=911321 RepID=UPI003742B86A
MRTPFRISMAATTSSDNNGGDDPVHANLDEKNNASTTPWLEKSATVRRCKEWIQQHKSAVNEEGIYHERQQVWFCAKHALNNLAQAPLFTKKDLDAVAHQLGLEETKQEELGPYSRLLVNPHKNPLGLGNYDISTLECALRGVGLEMRWFDARKDVRTIRFCDTLCGVIINQPSTNRWPWRMNHWSAVKMIRDHVYDLDSKLEHPRRFETLEDAYRFLDGVKRRNGQIFLVLGPGEKSV